MRAPLTIATVLTTLALTSVAHAALPNSVLGYWKTITGSVVRIAPCPSGICLTVVQLPSNAPEKTDHQNPDPNLRDRPLCNLIVGDDFEELDPKHLTGGKLYDPKSGHTYKGTITAQGDTLLLRGYFGFSIFGRTESWSRVAPVTACH